jgi:hypothetical protein
VLSADPAQHLTIPIDGNPADASFLERFAYFGQCVIEGRPGIGSVLREGFYKHRGDLFNCIVIIAS